MEPRDLLEAPGAGASAGASRERKRLLRSEQWDRDTRAFWIMALAIVAVTASVRLLSAAPLKRRPTWCSIHLAIPSSYSKIS